MEASAEQAKKPRKRRVFEVAKELKVVTPTIIKFLEENGFDVSRKQMHPVTEEMYVALLGKFDKSKLVKYQAEHATTKEAIQKRKSDRIRKEEQEKILAIGKEPVRKKVELPKYQTFIVKKAEEEQKKKAQQAKKRQEATGPKASKPKESAKPAVEKRDKVSEKAAGARKGKKKPPKTEIKDKAKAAEQAVKEAIAGDERKAHKEEIKDEAKAQARKIELPKPKHLRIVQQAPRKDEKLEQTQVAPDQKADIQEPVLSEKEQIAQDLEKAKKEPEDKTKATAPDEGVGEKLDAAATEPGYKKPEKTAKTKPGLAEADKPKPKRKLKRKRVQLKPESLEDALETEQDRELSKTIQKKTKQKPAPKKEAISEPKPPRKRRRKKAESAKPTIEAVEKTRKKKHKKVSKTEIKAAIRETMAKVEGRDKIRRKYSHGKSAEAEAEADQTLRLTEFITTQELADLMDVSYQELIQKCLGMGMLISINQRLDKDTIELLASEYGLEVEFVKDEELEEVTDVEKEENLAKRAPVVTIMGHVDHGKTTLLDHLRRTRVAEGEVGGITQHIGAYEVEYEKQKISFLDTPGHEAFTAMRARGAQITDIVVLVVAADDKVMPQTIEAIDHARAANTTIIVAVNKIDKPEANPEMIYKQLADQNILVEKWGGKFQSTEISAKFGKGIDDLLQEILLAAEMLELKADPSIRARGVVVESRLDKGLGGVATVLVQTGTLKVGDPIVVGEHYGRIRAMYDENGDKREEAGPAAPAQVVGFNGIPQAGDQLMVYPSEKEAREVSQRRQRQHREISARRIKSLTLEQASKQMQEAQLKELPLLLKGDVHGSVEVLADALMKLSTNEVKVDIVHKGVGGITESDVLLAATSGAIIIGFHVHPNLQARELARKEKVEIRLYRIIHEVIDEIHDTLEGLLSPIEEQQVVGHVEVRQVFKISRLGTIAGSYVTEGKITRNSLVRLIRDDIEIWSGPLASLKRFKDDVREVSQGYECGIALDGFKDIREGDRLEVFEIIKTRRKLDATA